LHLLVARPVDVGVVALLVEVGCGDGFLVAPASRWETPLLNQSSGAGSSVRQGKRVFSTVL
jgi:hypothetical protein